MKLACVSHYDPADGRSPVQSLLWELKRKDVVDVSSFFNAWRLTRGVAVFRHDNRPSEPVVAVSFRKATGCEIYSMPASEFKKLMGTNLVPGLC